VSGRAVGLWSGLLPLAAPGTASGPGRLPPAGGPPWPGRLRNPVGHRPMRPEPRVCRLGAGALLALVLLLAAGTGLAQPAFESPPARDSAGFFSLSWSGAERFELEQATAPDHVDARIIYRGGDTATTISGLPDGAYRFRIRADGNDTWSDEAVVGVEHHPLSRAFLFFALGAGVFLVLVLAIARGRKLA
jgi:hypothetical protein